MASKKAPARKKSLGSNPLGTKEQKSEPVLRDVLQGGAGASPKPAGPVAAVLSGNGAEAAFEAGVLDGLASKNGFDPELLTGVSVGAFNAAALAGHSGGFKDAVARLRGIWLERLAGSAWTGRNGLYRSRGDMRALMSPSRAAGAVADLVGDGTHWLRDAFRHGARVVRSGDELATRLLWLADVSSFLSLEPLADVARDVVDLKAVRASRRRLRVGVANWVTGQVGFRDGPSLDDKTGHACIVAAAARPGVFPCVELDGAHLVDAAPFVESDLGPAIEAGAGELHVPVFLARRPDGDRPASTVDALDRMLAHLQLGRLERELAELRARSPRPLTVHIYRSHLDATQSHGFLDVRRERIAILLDHGRHVATHHDCRESGCLTAN